MRGKGAAAALTAALIAVHLLSIPALVLPPRLGLFPGQTVEQSRLDAMNPFLLWDGVTHRIVFEVAWVEDCEPSAPALEAMVSTARAIVPASIEIEVVRDPVIPRAEWEALEHHDPEPLARARMLRRSDAGLGVKLLYVLSMPAPRDGIRDRSAEFRSWRRDPGDVYGTTDEQGIAVYRDAIAPWGFGWVSRESVETMVVVHELGHAFGLVGNGDHEASWESPGQHHCDDPGCLMAVPTPGWFLVNGWNLLAFRWIPPRFCGACRADIQGAMDAWSLAAGRDRSYAAKLVGRRKPTWWRAYATEMNAGRLDRSERIVLNVLSDDPDWERPHVFLGKVRERQARWDDAIAEYRKALRLDPTSFARESLARILVERRRLHEALDLLSPEVLAAVDALGYGEVLKIRQLRAEALVKSGRPMEAIPLLLANEGDPRASKNDRADAAASLARIHRRGGRRAAALDAIDRAEAYGRPSALGCLDRARVALAAGRLEDASRALQGALQALDASAPPRDGYSLVEHLYQRAAARAMANDAAGARADFDRIVAIESEHPESRLYEARILALLGDDGAALEALSGYAMTDRLDFCDDDDLERLREDPRFGRRFPECLPTVP